MAAAWSAVERARGGQSATVLVGGDAGVGKSRLVSHLAEEAKGDGVLVLVGRCVDMGDGELPYAPIAGALRDLSAQLEPDALDDALGRGAILARSPSASPLPRRARPRPAVSRVALRPFSRAEAGYMRSQGPPTRGSTGSSRKRAESDG